MLYRHLTDEMAWERDSEWQASSVWVSDDPFDIWAYEDYFCDNEGDMMRTCQFTIPKKSPFEENYYLMFPHCSRKYFLNDLAVLSEFSQAWGIDVEPISMKEEWLALKEKEPAMSLYSEDGSALEPEDLEDYFWVDVSTWTGIPCKLPPDTIEKKQFPPMKGHKWSVETEQEKEKEV